MIALVLKPAWKVLNSLAGDISSQSPGGARFLVCNAPQSLQKVSGFSLL